GLPHPELAAEADLLHVEVHLRERQLLGKRDRHSLAEAQRSTQEVGQADAHLARFVGIDSRERADGVQAVEEKVRIDLSPERFKSRVASKNFGTSRSLKFERGIVQRHSHQVKEKNDDGKNRNSGCEPLAQTRQKRRERGRNETAEQQHAA